MHEKLEILFYNNLVEMHIIKRNSKTIILTLIPLILSKAHFSMETENERYIKNKFPSQPADQNSLDELQAQAIRILQKGISSFYLLFI